MKLKNMLYELIKGIILGALILSILSALQKFILYRQLALDLNSYFIPILFGGTTGLIIKSQFLKMKQLNKKLKIENEKYELVLDSTSKLSVMKNHSEKEFLSKIYTISKEIIKKHDYGMVFIYKNKEIVPIIAEGYNFEKTTNYEFIKSIIDKIYFETKIYNLKDVSLESKISEWEFEEFSKISPNSKEALFLT